MDGAILQFSPSGSIENLTHNLVADVDETRPLAELLKEKLGVTTVAELEKIPLEDLARFHEENVDRVPCLPCCDGYIVPKEPFEAWCNGASAEYDILQGV